MTTALLDEQETIVAKKRDDQAVKIERRIAMMLRVIVEAENMDRPSREVTNVAELLSNLVRDQVMSMHQEALKKLGCTGTKKPSKQGG